MMAFMANMRFLHFRNHLISILVVKYIPSSVFFFFLFEKGNLFWKNLSFFLLMEVFYFGCCCIFFVSMLLREVFKIAVNGKLVIIVNE